MNATSAGTRRNPPRAKPAKPEKKTSRSTAAERKIVLVGTYHRRQMERWILPRGLYNYPVKEKDTVILEDAPLVSEIWLYLGKAGKRRFSAALDRLVSAAELDALGYPKGMGPHHADRYLLFRVKPLPDDAAPPDAAGAPAPHIDIRIDDFAHSEELQAKLRERFAGAPPKTPTEAERKTCFDCLPEDLLEDWLGNLFVCEEAEQLNFASTLFGASGGRSMRFREDDAIFEDRRFGEIARLASRDAVARTFAAGLPVTFWKDGRLFHQFPDGRECPVPASEISEVIGSARP